MRPPLSASTLKPFRHSAILWAILLLVLTTDALRSQTLGDRVGPQLPFLSSSARSMALADAGSSIIDDFSGFGSNPAVLGLTKRSAIDYSVQRIQKGITFEHLGLVYKTTTLDALAFGLDILHYGGTDFYTKSEVRNLGFEVRTGLAYGRSLSEALSMGINLQALMTTTGPNSIWAFLGDIGLAYAPGKYIRYGVFVKGLGSDYDVQASLLSTDRFTKHVVKTLGLSVTIDFPFSDHTKKVLIAVQNEKLIGESGLLYRLGVEYYPFLTTEFDGGFRGGIVVRGREIQPRFGLGLRVTQFSLDYGYSYAKRFNQPSHMITVSFMWPH
jgi:hypothetical protein